VNEVDLVLEPEASMTPAADTAAAPGVATERAQAVRCGQRWIAFPYGWARSAVERVALSAVPGAPAWLAGAANVDGRIVPVIDLLAWSQPGQGIDAHAKDARLMVGGDGDDSVAVLFQGMPRLVRVAREKNTDSAGADRLAPYLHGRDPEDAATVALDAPRWVEALIEELALR
jgi:chemotaxis signal transduction protein